MTEADRLGGRLGMVAYFAFGYWTHRQGWPVWIFLGLLMAWWVVVDCVRHSQPVKDSGKG